MSSFFSSDGSFSLQFAIIFVVIFLVLAIGVFLLRRFTGRGSALSSRTPPRGRQPRLGIVDIYELDRQRQLILLRRDNVEHLLLVGGPNDVVVERNILRGINARLQPEEAAYDEAPEPAATSAVTTSVDPVGDLSGPPPGFPSYQQAAPYLEPSFEMPVVVPPPVPGSDAPPPTIARPLEIPPRIDFGEVVRPPQPSAAPPEPPVKQSPFARVMRRAPPSLVNLVPAALAERVRPTEPASSAAPPPPQIPPFVAPPNVAPPVISAPAARAIDAAILSDMARQLEEALRRPSAAVRPSLPIPPEPANTTPEEEFIPAETGTAPERDGDTAGVDPIAAAMAATAHESVVEPAAVTPADEPEKAAAAPPAAEPAEAPIFVAPPAPVAPVPDEPAPEAAALKPAVAHKTTPESAPPVATKVDSDAPPVAKPELAVLAPKPVPDPAPVPPVAVKEAVAKDGSGKAASGKAASSPNPFSVEEIEAEFARLLGRPLERKQ